MERNRRSGATEPLEVDLRGLRCPLPALRTEKLLATMARGIELVVLADDPLARLDIANLCREGRHSLIDVVSEGGGWRFRIRPREA